jgi:hypothetical protein
MKRVAGFARPSTEAHGRLPPGDRHRRSEAILVRVTARDGVLDAARVLAARSPDGTFTVDDVVRFLRQRGSTYAESTIRTHVTSRMCANAPDHHASVFADLLRVSHGQYRLNT